MYTANKIEHFVSESQPNYSLKTMSKLPSEIFGKNLIECSEIIKQDKLLRNFSLFM